MLNTQAWRASATPMLALWLAACGGAEALIIPLFEFGFSGSSGAVQIQIFFGPDKPTASSGNFDFVNMNVDANPQIHFSGNYSGCNFNLALIPPVPPDTVPAPIANSYCGSFTGNDTIELRPTSCTGLPVLALKRQGTGSRTTGC
jgi:hypothetical protein